MKLGRITLKLTLLAALGLVMVCSGVYLHLSPSLPSVDVLRDIRLQTPMRVYSREGDLIGQFGEQKRNPLGFDEIPPRFIEALLAAEDDAFFDHAGVDLMGLMRAISELVLTGEKGSGGSTLTMQVARNYFLTLERTFTRKFKEILLSLEIERKLNKQEIFELYFNRVFLGHRAYGFEAAAQVYYGSHIDELNLAQLAMLAGLPKAPSRFNPISNPERALVRRDWILDRMLDLEFITGEDHAAALAAPVTASHHGAKLVYDAPYAAEMARREMINRYGLAAYNDGYHVYTTISSELQQAANRAVVEGLFLYDERHGYRGPEAQYPAPTGEDPTDYWLSVLAEVPAVDRWQPAIVVATGEDRVDLLLADGRTEPLPWENGLRQARPWLSENAVGARPESPAQLFSSGDLIRVRLTEEGQLYLSQLPEAQAALVALRPDDGAMLSVVGGLGFQKSKFNRVTQANRQPGSNFKPFIYAAALENGFTAASIINDAPVVFRDANLEDTWRPDNDSGEFYGPTRLRLALTKSRNLVSIRLLEALGIQPALDYVERFGFDREELAADLSLALGSQVLTPLELVTAYASLANGGYRVLPYLVQRVEDGDGNLVFEAEPATVCRPCEVEPLPGSEELSMEAILKQPTVPALPQAKRIIDKRVAFIIHTMLQDVITSGTGRKAAVALERGDIAGKTGTTNGPTDAWFSGYNADVVASAWVGFDQNRKLGRKEFGGTAALPIWIDFMKVALADSPESSRQVPEGVVTVRIDPDTGLLAVPRQSNAIFEYFREERVPAAGERVDTDYVRDNIEEDLLEQLY
jgi:penicillin-binding protein 1A